MALRNIKITRDIVQTCNKVRAFKRDLLTSLPQKPAEVPENAPRIHSMSYSVNCECKDPRNILSEINATKENKYIASPLIKLLKKRQLSMSSSYTGSKYNLKGRSVLLTASRLGHQKKRNEAKQCKKKCQKNLPCPKFNLVNCPPPKAPKSDCARVYIDPKCSKKMAPYPSYSELCAYRLEDDPSECQQCPWDKCGGADNIRPQKKGYHTSTRSMNTAVPSGGADNMPPLSLDKECDASKKPCKEPPPKCKKTQKKKKCPEKKEKKKKCDTYDMLPEAWTICGSLNNLEVQRYKFSKVKFELLKEDIGVPSNLAEKIVYQMKKHCPKEPKCPTRKIGPAVVNHRIDAEPVLEMAKKHDKGHPPPCPDKKHPSSEHCPDDADRKKIYRKEHDLYDPAYRRSQKPYSDNDATK